MDQLRGPPEIWRFALMTRHSGSSGDEVTPSESGGEEWVAADDAAQRLGMSTSFFKRFAQENGLRSKGWGRSRCYHVADVEKVRAFQGRASVQPSQRVGSLRASDGSPAGTDGVPTARSTRGRVRWRLRLVFGASAISSGPVVVADQLGGVRFGCPNCSRGDAVLLRERGGLGGGANYYLKCKSCGKKTPLAKTAVAMSLERMLPDQVERLLRL